MTETTAHPQSAQAGAARAYHDATRHSWQSVRADDHALDWETKPLLFKIYPEAAAIPLPREVAPPERPTLETLAAGDARGRRDGLDLAALTQLLLWSAGITKKKVYPGGQAIHFRAAASTGALYEVEVYLAAAVVPGLEPGVYHFCPGDFTLRQLRRGDYRGALAEAAGEPERVLAAPATLVLSAIYWRNAWKYRARAYRHFFWNAGTLLANLLATAVALDVPARVLLGFADGAVNHLLGLDVQREASLALIPLGTSTPPPAGMPAVPPLGLRTVPLSAREVDYPLVREAYLASALPDGAAARAWVGGRAGPRGERTPPALPSLPRTRSLGDTILRRGSTRQFSRDAIGRADLLTILDVASRPWPLDADDLARPLVDAYLLVHAVDGLAAGAYVHEPATGELRLLRAGEFRAEGGYLCLEQSLGADASAVVFFLSDLGPILARYGNRGYRAANLAAGLCGGRMYLAAYALGLGATGLTFYDDDVVRFFSPHAAGKDALFVTALGRSRRLERPQGLAQIEGELRPVRPGES